MAEQVATTNAAQAGVDLNRWAAQFGPAVYKDVGPLADVLVQRAQQVVPVISGDLRDSIAAEQTPAGLAVVGGVDYAGWVEFGGTRGRPYVAEGRYVYPAVVAHEDELESHLDTAVQQSIDRYPWTNPTGG